MNSCRQRAISAHAVLQRVRSRHFLAFQFWDTANRSALRVATSSCVVPRALPLSDFRRRSHV